MGRQTIYVSDLPDAKGNYNQVADPDELQYVFVGIGGEVFQLEITEGEAQTFKKAVQKYVDAAEKAHSDSDPRVISDAFSTKDGYRSSAMRAATRSFTPGSAGKSSLTGAELAGKVAGLKFTDEIDGLAWAAENKLKPGDAVPESSKGLKTFVEAMGEDPGTTRIPNDSYWSAIEKAQEKGLVTKPA